MLNIPSQVADPQYRYKMPRLITKKESRGKGSKTCIVNMGDVAAALKRPPQYVTKWFSTELGAQTSYTNNVSEGERAIVNGHHDTYVFQELLDKFIEKYVCCKICSLPEVFMVVRKGIIQGRCMACGWQGDLDNTHKLATFIQRNPPDKSGQNIQMPIEGGGKINKKAKQTKGEASISAQPEVVMNEDTSDDAAKVLSASTISLHKHQEEKNNGKGGHTKEKKEKHHKEEHNQLVEKRDKHETKHDKKEKKEKKATKPSESDDIEDKNNEDEAFKYGGKQVKALVNKLRAFNSSGNVSHEEFYEELRMRQLANCLDHKLRLYITLEVLCGSKMNANSVKQNKDSISKMISQANMPQAHIIWAFNAYVHGNPDCLRCFAPVLKVLYDEDWADEHTILEHYNDDSHVNEPGFEEAKKAAAPFLKWLQTAETDDSEQDEKGEGSA